MGREPSIIKNKYQGNKVISFKQYLIEEKFDLDSEYDKFNKEYFNSELPKIPVTYKNLKPHGVCIGFKNKATKQLRVDRIYISSKYNMDYEHFKKILIHEMIHAYLMNTNRHDTSMHGVWFVGLMKKMNNQYGLNLDTKAEAADLAVPNKKHFAVFLVNKLKEPEGNKFKYLLSICKLEQYKEFLETLEARYEYTFKDLYVLDSTDDALIHYPLARNARTIKYFGIDKESFDYLISVSEIIEHIKD